MLKTIGYWSDSPDDGRPRPQDLVDLSWGESEASWVAIPEDALTHLQDRGWTPPELTESELSERRAALDSLFDGRY